MKTTIKQMRMNLGMTQKEFADFCGVGVITINRYESGKAMQREQVEKISKACGVPAEEFWDPELLKHKKEKIINEFNTEETNVVEEYRKLSRWGQSRVKEYLHELKILYPRLDEKQNSVK